MDMKDILHNSFYEYISITIGESSKEKYIAKIFQVFWTFWIFVYVTILFGAFAIMFAIVVIWGLIQAMPEYVLIEGRWAAYALVLGMAISFLVQSVQETNQAPNELFDSFITNLFYFIMFFWAVAFWIFVLF